MKFRQNEFYAIEGNLLNLLIKYSVSKTHNAKHVLNRIINETIELDCQEKRCSFNKERGNDEKTK